MNAKLKALFLVLAAGAGFLVVQLRPGVTPADAVDAGILPISSAGRIRCVVRITDECRTSMGIARRYGTVQARARIIRDAGIPALLLPDGGVLAPAEKMEPIIALDLPTAWLRCLRLVGSPREVCQVLEEGACTDATVCPANAPPQVEQLQCACRPAAGVCTRLDAGVPPFGVTLAAGQWVGAGCVRKHCGPVLFGDDADWPATCPGGP